ncbi:MAG: MmgE/PrpD family protein [Chloroflexi bacterium]|nr:MmgE/PrpD family protein [Chloroflexota bacterium]
MGATARLAEFVAKTPSSKIPDQALDAANVGLMDSVGTALVANIHDIGKIITGYTNTVGGKPTATVIGTSIKTSAPDAALANATLGHSDDYDDVGGFGHPSVVLMPTVLALGEQLHKSGREVLDAYCLGFEVGTRIGSGIGADHYGRGWHSTSTIGAMASAAAAARLLGLDTDHTRTALGIAASLASGVQANFGTMTKPLHPGNAARSGIMAATLAQMGYTANQDIIEAPSGYVAVFGDQQANINAMTTQLGEAPLHVISGIRIKEWPCCYGHHGVIPMLVELVQKYEIRASQVERVDFISGMAYGFLNRPDADTYFGGKFSLQFNIAAALVDGKVTYETFTDEKINSAPIRDMMARVHLGEDPMVERLPARIRGAHQEQKVVVTLKDGRQLTNQIEHATNTLKGHQVDIKFEANAAHVLPSAQAKQALAAFRDLKKVKDVAEIMPTVAKK